MPDEFKQNPWQPEQSASAQAAIPSVAAPPVEVSVRTMASDLASLGETGGGPPRPVNIAVPSLNQGENSAVRGPAAAQEEDFGSSSKKKFFIWGLAGMLGAAVLFLGGYYFLPLFSSNNPNPSSAIVRATSTIASSAPAFAHHSFFSQPVDGALVLGAAASTEGLEAYRARVNGVIAGISSSTPAFFDASLQNTKGEPLSAANFLDSIGANIWSSKFISLNFNADFTFFLYKDKNGVWPGYAFQLGQNKSPILLQQDLRKIESAPNLKNLFLNDPGFLASAFQDGLASGQPVRMANFSDKKSVLVYGWFFNKYLIVSTSLGGLTQALAHF